MKTYDSREGYDLYAPNYKKDHQHLDSFDWDTARACIVSTIEEMLANSHASAEGSEAELCHPLRILDLGCGDGRVLKRLVRLLEQRGWGAIIELYGWDISDGMLKEARKAVPPSVQLQQQNLLDVLAVDSTRFNLVLSFFVLVHIESPAQFLAAITNLLAPGGYALFNSIPQREALVLGAEGKKFQIEYEHHSPENVLFAVENSGLELVQHNSGQWSELFLARKQS